MRSLIFYIFLFITIITFASCKDTAKKVDGTTSKQRTITDTIKNTEKEVLKDEQEKAFELTEDNAIDFFFNYEKTLKSNKVKITTNLGSFTIELFDNVPYHRANFIYLTEKGYFNYTQFHRVVKNFIIQGGNSDDAKTGKKRTDIGRYLLPPDTRKGHKHHRGTVSMPSSELDNPHMLASPFEFFIVVTDPGSYHLDDEYTPFGRVIEGMNVVDKINNVPVEKGDWPLQNIYIEKAEVLE
ncbi:peptidylprolyl isomerase [Maribacter ulvicola]|uniref:Peptidyl-prolyl cis-trans isomerase n=1 Tax=Maribacter ulvicola TaxID=228959 RepID=A0A1N6XJ28_9FLAO|nr:peptidylprolyl isomerase [Maribacter ulvicola]SIR02355.1 Peptidyl-prolyl cis-trans isomerase (rotamase)-cyclophilin family [Maribacter ulvicola]